MASAQVYAPMAGPPAEMAGKPDQAYWLPADSAIGGACPPPSGGADYWIPADSDVGLPILLPPDGDFMLMGEWWPTVEVTFPPLSEDDWPALCPVKKPPDSDQGVLVWADGWPGWPYEGTYDWDFDATQHDPDAWYEDTTPGLQHTVTVTYTVDNMESDPAESGYIRVFDADLTLEGGSSDQQDTVEDDPGFFMAKGTRKQLTLRLQPSNPDDVMPSSFNRNRDPRPPLPPHQVGVYESGGYCVSFYGQAEGGEPLTCDELSWGWQEIDVDLLSKFPTPEHLYVQAVAPGTCTIVLGLGFRCPEECGDWLGESSATDTVKVTVVGVDLDIDNVVEDDEEEPGGFVALGGLLPITLQPVLPAGLPGTDVATLTWTNDAKIDVYENQNRTSPIDSGKTYALSALPKPLYVEGDAASDQPRDVEIKLSYTKGGATAEDVVKVTVMVEVESVHPVSGDFASGLAGRLMISTSKDDYYYTIVNTTASDTVARTSDGQVTISAYVTPKVEGARVYFEVLDPDDLSPYERDAYVTADFTPDGDGNDDVISVSSTSAYTADPTNGTEVAIWAKTATEAAATCRVRRVKAKTTSTITVADLDTEVPTHSLVRLTVPEAKRNDNSDGFGTMAGGTLSAYNGFQNCLSARSAEILSNVVDEDGASFGLFTYAASLTSTPSSNRTPRMTLAISS